MNSKLFKADLEVNTKKINKNSQNVNEVELSQPGIRTYYL